MTESVENKDNTLRDWAKDKVQKSLAEALNRFEKPEKRKIKPCLLENDTEILFYQPQSATVSREPLLYLEFSKPNKQNVSEIYVFNKIQLSPLSKQLLTR